jgi:hypothetical protein
VVDDMYSKSSSDANKAVLVWKTTMQKACSLNMFDETLLAD